MKNKTKSEKTKKLKCGKCGNELIMDDEGFGFCYNNKCPHYRYVLKQGVKA